MLVSFVLCFLTFVDEFRYITIEHVVKIADRRTYTITNPSNIVN